MEPLGLALRKRTRFTCGPVSLMEVLRLFFPERPLDPSEEFRLWQRSATLPIRGSSIYALATVAAETGLDVNVYTEELGYRFPKHLDFGYSLEEVQWATETTARFMSDARAAGVILTEEPLTPERVVDILATAPVSMVRIDSSILHDTPSYHSSHLVAVEPRGESMVVHDSLLGSSFRVSKGDLMEMLEDVHRHLERNLLVATFHRPGLTKASADH